MGNIVNIFVKEDGNKFKLDQICDLVCFFLAFQEPIAQLYDAFIKAIELKGKGKCFCFCFTVPKLGRKVYSGQQIINLECQSQFKSLRELCFSDEEVPKCEMFDRIVMILFKIRLELINLYQSECRVLAQRSMGKCACVCFTNPLNCCIPTDSKRVVMTNFQFLKLCCQCKNRPNKFVIKDWRIESI